MTSFLPGSQKRSASSKISWQRALAIWRPASASSVLPPMSLMIWRAESRICARASPSASLMCRMSPSGTEVWARSSAAAAESSSETTPSWTVVCLRTELVAAESMLVLICPDRALVTRSLSSWASSMMMTSCSGRTFDSPKASMASRAWFVTTISASAALFRAISAKHSVNSGQFEPRQSKALTETCDQARSLTPGRRSSRSPVSVVFSQVRIRWISSPRPERSAGLRPASASAPRSKSMPSPSSGYPPESLCLHT